MNFRESKRKTKIIDQNEKWLRNDFQIANPIKNHYFD